MPKGDKYPGQERGAKSQPLLTEDQYAAVSAEEAPVVLDTARGKVAFISKAHKKCLGCNGCGLGPLTPDALHKHMKVCEENWIDPEAQQQGQGQEANSEAEEAKDEGGRFERGIDAIE